MFDKIQVILIIKPSISNNRISRLNNVKMVYYGTETSTFLGPRIWEILPDYIKKSKSVEEFKLKIKLCNSENCPCKLCKRFFTITWFFITCLWIFHAARFIISKDTFHEKYSSGSIQLTDLICCLIAFTSWYFGQYVITCLPVCEYIKFEINLFLIWPKKLEHSQWLWSE